MRERCRACDDDQNRTCHYRGEWGCLYSIEPAHSPIALLVGAGLIVAIMFGLPWLLAAGEVAFK